MPDPSWTAQLDQAVAAARDFAGAVAIFHAALVDQGMDPDAATSLTAVWMNTLLTQTSEESE